MRFAALISLALLAPLPVIAAEPPPDARFAAERYADGRGFADEALDNLLSPDGAEEGDAEDLSPLDPNGPTDCMLRLDAGALPA